MREGGSLPRTCCRPAEIQRVSEADPQAVSSPCDTEAGLLVANGTAAGMIDDAFYDHSAENLTLCTALEPQWRVAAGVAVGKNSTELNGLLSAAMMRMVKGGEGSVIIQIENATMVASGYPPDPDLQVRPQQGGIPFKARAGLPWATARPLSSPEPHGTQGGAAPSCAVLGCAAQQMCGVATVLGPSIWRSPAHLASKGCCADGCRPAPAGPLQALVADPTGDTFLNPAED